MINAKATFNFDELRRKAAEATKQTIRSRIAGFPNVKISFDCDGEGFPVELHFDGPEEDVKKARDWLAGRLFGQSPKRSSNI